MMRLDSRGERTPEHIEIGVIMGQPLEGDEDLFFGPLTDDDVFLYLPAGELLWCDLLAHLGVFRSKSQARKSGWNRLIPLGFSDETIGRLRHHISVLNLSKDDCSA